MGALERQEDKISAQVSSGPVSVCVLCYFIQACSQAMTRYNQETVFDVYFLLPSRPMTFHNVIVVSRVSAGHETRDVALALLRFLC